MISQPSTYRVGDIPTLVVRPDPAADHGGLALWMHYLGGTKEAMIPALQQLAGDGFTAVSFDAWAHGERALMPVPELMARVFAQFRATMWPILGRTVLDALAVVDHALATFGREPNTIVAGGVSMGGDLAISLAGIETRISRVAAMIATPDWTRPGMTRLDDPAIVINQGQPTTLGQWFYEQLDPMSHLQRYRRRLNITFDLGGQDYHIPRANAEAFRTALTRLEPDAADRIRIRVHDGLDHMAAGRDSASQAAAWAFLTTPLTPHN